MVALNVPSVGVRRALPVLAWTLTYYSKLGREKLHVRYLASSGQPRNAALDCWLQYDDAKPHHARIAWFPLDMDEEVREMLLADLFAHWTGESTDWERATLQQVESAVVA